MRLIGKVCTKYPYIFEISIYFNSIIIDVSFLPGVYKWRDNIALRQFSVNFAAFDFQEAINQDCVTRLIFGWNYSMWQLSVVEGSVKMVAELTSFCEELKENSLPNRRLDSQSSEMRQGNDSKQGQDFLQKVI